MTWEEKHTLYPYNIKLHIGINTSVTVRKPQTIPPSGMPAEAKLNHVVPTTHNLASVQQQQQQQKLQNISSAETTSDGGDSGSGGGGCSDQIDNIVIMKYQNLFH